MGKSYNLALICEHHRLTMFTASDDYYTMLWRHLDSPWAWKQNCYRN